MGNDLAALEVKRAELYQQLQETGDFRRGTISVLYRKCGKKNCACTHEGHPGHGPLHLWNATIRGKSYARNVKPGTELEKYLEEIDNHHRFVRLCGEIVETNEQICALRPLPVIADEDELAELKKKQQKRLQGKYKEKWSAS